MAHLRATLAVVSSLCLLMACDDGDDTSSPVAGPTKVQCFLVNTSGSAYGVISAYDTTDSDREDVLDTLLLEGNDTLLVAWCSTDHPDGAPESFVVAVVFMSPLFSYFVGGVELDTSEWTRVGNDWYHTIDTALVPCCEGHEYDSVFPGDWKVTGLVEQVQPPDTCLFNDTITGLCVVSSTVEDVYEFGTPMYVRVVSRCLRFSNTGIACRPRPPEPVKYWFTRADSLYLGTSWLPSDDPELFTAYRYQVAPDAIRLTNASDTLVLEAITP